MLRQIEISNFKKHRELSCSFEPGINLVVGKNWAGKSTLLWAIVYALFGPSYVPGGSKLVSPRGGGKPSVRLSMSLHGHSYQVLRTPDKAELTKDGEMVANGAATVTKVIEDLLGMSAATFISLRMAQQNEASAILTLGVTKLSQIVDQITKVDVVDQIIKLASSQVVLLNDRLSAMPEQDMVSLQESVETCKQDLQVAQANREAAETEKTKAALASAEAHKVWRALLNSLEAFRKQERDLQQAHQAIATLNGAMQAILPEATLEEIDLEPLRRDQKLREARESAQWRIANLRADMEETEKRGASLKAPSWTSSDDARLSELEQGVREWQHRCGELSASIKTMVLATEQAVCPTCGRPMEGHDPDKLNAELEELWQMQDEAKSALHAANSAYDTLHARHKEWTRKCSEIAHHAAALERFRSSLATAEEDLDGLEEPASDSMALANAQASNKRRAKAVEEYHGIKLELARWEQHISSVVSIDQPDVAAVEQAETRHYRLEKEKYQAVENLHTATFAESQAAAATARASEALEAAKRADEVRSTTAKSLELNKQLLTYLRKNRDTFTAKVWSSLLSRCSEFVSAATCGQVSEVVRSSDGQFQYVEEGSRMPVSAASGVQQAVIGVGVRMALAAALGGSAGFLLLDEITAGAHDDLSIEIVRALAESAPQAISVTHRQADAAVADHLISL